MHKPKCFICGKRLRLPYFPESFYFWLQKAAIYKFTADIEDATYGIKAVLCEPCVVWAEANNDVAELLLVSKIKLHRKDSD